MLRHRSDQCLDLGLMTEAFRLHAARETERGLAAALNLPPEPTALELADQLTSFPIKGAAHRRDGSRMSGLDRLSVPVGADVTAAGACQLGSLTCHAAPGGPFWGPDRILSKINVPSERGEARHAWP